MTETPDMVNNQPYSTHSPRSSPLQGRRSGKQRKFAQHKSGDSGFSSKGTIANPSLQRSVDSSFASTDADLANRSQQLSSFSDNEPSSSHNYQTAQQSTRPKQFQAVLRNNPPFNEISINGRVDPLVDDSWGHKKNNEFISNTNDTLSSNSSQEFIQTSFERHDGKVSYNGAVLANRTKWNPNTSDADDSNSERGNETLETSFMESQHQQRHLTVRKDKARPPSLSEVPLPPPSMLNETHEYEDENTSLISSPNNRKNAFQNPSRLRGTLSYADSTDSERQFMVENNNVVT